MTLQVRVQARLDRDRLPVEPSSGWHDIEDVPFVWSFTSSDGPHELRLSALPPDTADHRTAVAHALTAAGLDVQSWAAPTLGELTEPVHLVRYHGRVTLPGSAALRPVAIVTILISVASDQGHIDGLELQEAEAAVIAACHAGQDLYPELAASQVVYGDDLGLVLTGEQQKRRRFVASAVTVYGGVL